MASSSKELSGEKNMTNNVERKKSGYWGWLIAVILLAVAVMFIFAIISKGKEINKKRTDAVKNEQPLINVVTMTIIPKTIRDRISLPGIIKAWVELEVITEVEGIVLKKEIKEGDTINQGDVLIVIDASKYKNRYKSAKASYDSALATKKRLAKLFKNDLASRADMDTINASVETNKASLDNAALDLNKCVVKAPVSGVINQIFIEKGQYLKMSSPIVQIIQMDRVKVRVGIPESDVNAVRHLTDFFVKIDALSGKVFNAKKYFLSRTASSQARLYNLDLEIDNKQGEILPDMFARVEIVKKRVENSITIPLYASITMNDKQFVYVEKGGVVTARPIQIGIQEGWEVEVTEGLKGGENIVVIGQRNVNDGLGVNVIKTIVNPEDILK